MTNTKLQNGKQDSTSQLFFTVKQWKRFDLPKQEHLCKKFDVILTNHKTRHERFIGVVENIDITSAKGRRNLNRVLDKMDRGFILFDKYNKQLFSDDPKKYKAMTG